MLDIRSLACNICYRPWDCLVGDWGYDWGNEDISLLCFWHQNSFILPPGMLSGKWWESGHLDSSKGKHHQHRSNLPLILTSTMTKGGLTFSDASAISNADIFQTYLNVTDETNQNLTPSQQELIRFWNISTFNGYDAYWPQGKHNQRNSPILCSLVSTLQRPHIQDFSTLPASWLSKSNRLPYKTTTNCSKGMTPSSDKMTWVLAARFRLINLFLLSLGGSLTSKERSQSDVNTQEAQSVSIIPPHLYMLTTKFL